MNIFTLFCLESMLGQLHGLEISCYYHFCHYKVAIFFSFFSNDGQRQVLCKTIKCILIDLKALFNNVSVHFKQNLSCMALTCYQCLWQGVQNEALKKIILQKHH